MTTHTRVTIRPGFTMQMQIPAVVKRPGSSLQPREVRLQCDAATPSTVVLNLRGPGPSQWLLDRGQLVQALSGDDTALDLPALREITFALFKDRLAISRRSHAGVTTVSLRVPMVDLFLDLSGQRIDPGTPR